MRVFIALKLPEKTTDNLARSAEQLRHFDCGGNFVPTANYHVTLHFLGEVAPSDLIYIQSAMDEVASLPAPTMSVSQICTLRVGDLVWAKFRSDKNLSTLHETLAQRLEEQHFTVEHRAYRPHVTLVRKYKFTLPFSEVSKSVDVYNMPFVAEEIVLYSSELRPEGAIYTPLYTVKLAQPQQN